ncbi:MAG: FAD-dependent oxidoreductase [Rhodospirillales bacterium]|nr:MAG: FAD-dependent oxidoreductase [Rhodospirillales bacterium]
MPERFDAIVVGAGPAGNAAALTLAEAGVSVLLLERGEYPGSKNVQGAIMYADQLQALIPDFRDDAPLERHIVEQRIWMLDDSAHVGTHYRSDGFNEELPNRYTIIRAQFDKWFAKKVQAAGALLICETTVTELLKDGDRVVGVRTDRAGGDIHADVVILADGVNALVAQRSGLRDELKPDNVALAVKEMHFLPEEVIQQRFNIGENEGVVIEAAGTITDGMLGTGFIYTNRESLSVGIGCLVSDFAASKTRPYDLLERFKQHPSIRPLLAGSEVKEYAAHLIPEGGYRAVPKVFGDGWLMAGDAGQFVNSLHREGSNMAMTTGRIAAETVIDLKREGKPMNGRNLSLYRKRLEDSYVMKDLRKYRDLPQVLHRNKQFVTTYPKLLAGAADTWFRVDGVDKRSKERQIVRSFLKGRSLRGLVGDALRLARAVR